MNADNLKVVLEKHKMWLKGRPEGLRADFRGADHERTGGMDLFMACLWARRATQHLNRS